MIKGIIIIFICLFVYVLIGTAILEIMLWHVRKGDNIIDDWLDDPVEESEQTLTVIFWPLLVPDLFIHILKKLIKFMFKETGIIIKGIRIFYTAIIFLISAAIIHKEKRMEKAEAQQENREYKTNKLDRAKDIIKDNYKSARCGIYDCKNNAGGAMYVLYYDDDIEIDICYHYEYFEVFGLTDDEFKDLEKYYDKLVEG